MGMSVPPGEIDPLELPVPPAPRDFGPILDYGGPFDPTGLGKPDGVSLYAPIGRPVCWTSPGGASQPQWDFTALQDCTVKTVVATHAHADIPLPWGGPGGDHISIGNIPVDATVVPLPAGLWLLLPALAALRFFRRRRLA